MEQYCKTAIVECIPPTHMINMKLHEFFDFMFPGQIAHAEVLLNAEHSHSLIKERMDHIIKYKNAYAKKVHSVADYLRQCYYAKHGNVLNVLGGWIKKPKKSSEPMILVKPSSKRSVETLSNLVVAVVWAALNVCGTQEVSLFGPVCILD